MQSPVPRQSPSDFSQTQPVQFPVQELGLRAYILAALGYLVQFWFNAQEQFYRYNLLQTNSQI